MIVLTGLNILFDIGGIAVGKLGGRRRFRHSRAQAGNISEFACCLFVFFLFALFPLINLIMFAANCGTVQLITRNAAAAASAAPTTSAALTAMQNSVTNDLSGGFGKFSSLTANGGYNGCGADLYLVDTSTSGGADQVFGPNPTLGGNADPSNNIYEYRVVSNFNLQPFVNMSSVPFIGSVPVVGSATPFSFSAERAVEDPTSLGNGTVLAGTTASPLSQVFMMTSRSSMRAMMASPSPSAAQAQAQSAPPSASPAQ